MSDEAKVAREEQMAATARTLEVILNSHTSSLVGGLASLRGDERPSDVGKGLLFSAFEDCLVAAKNSGLPISDVVAALRTLETKYLV